jgi:formylglycine-generating enzyme required for sulfatase activity
MSMAAQPGAASSTRGMVRIPGGTFLMGAADFYPEERPVHQVIVDRFWMDAHPVTVAEFRRFVKATGYVTVAERALDPADYPDADPAALVPGALVFRMTPGPVGLDDWRQWWSYAPGACWRRPLGSGSTLNGRQLHPVTQVAYEDAAAYAAWAGKGLPTEAEWEFAARGGLESAVFPWGDEFTPKGRRMANTWHGAFPWQYLARRLPVAIPAGRQGAADSGNQPGAYVSAQRLRPVRRGRQRLGVDLRLLRPAPPRSRPQGLLRTPESTG